MAGSGALGNWIGTGVLVLDVERVSAKATALIVEEKIFFGDQGLARDGVGNPVPEPQERIFIVPEDCHEMATTLAPLDPGA